MRSSLKYGLVTIFVLAACNHVTASVMCGCSPIVATPTVIKAVVRTAQDEPAAQARVVLETLANGQCDVGASGTVGSILSANAQGELYVSISRFSNSVWCMRATAEGATVAQGRPSAPSLVSMRAVVAGVAVQPETTTVLLRLRQ